MRLIFGLIINNQINCYSGIRGLLGAGNTRLDPNTRKKIAGKVSGYNITTWHYPKKTPDATS